MDADIIALQEIENRDLKTFTKKNLPKYKHYSFIKYPNFCCRTWILSKIEIKKFKNLDVKFETKLFFFLDPFFFFFLFMKMEIQSILIIIGLQKLLEKL